MTDNANERLYTWYYLCDTCRYADDDGVGISYAWTTRRQSTAGSASGRLATKDYVDKFLGEKDE